MYTGSDVTLARRPASLLNIQIMKCVNTARIDNGNKVWTVDYTDGDGVDDLHLNTRLKPPRTDYESQIPRWFSTVQLPD